MADKHAKKGYRYTVFPWEGGQEILNDPARMADLIDRAQSGDREALYEVMNSGANSIFIQDVPGLIDEFENRDSDRGSDSEGLEGK